MMDSGLPIQISCLVMGFQWASVCGRPSGVRVTSIFQAYSNPFVKDVNKPMVFQL